MEHNDSFSNHERSMIRRSLTILRNVDPTRKEEIDSLISRIENLSKTAYDAHRNGKTDLSNRRNG